MCSLQKEYPSIATYKVKVQFKIRFIYEKCDINQFLD